MNEDWELDDEIEEWERNMIAARVRWDEFHENDEEFWYWFCDEES